MLDPQLLRNKTEEVAAVLQTRGYLLDVERFQSLEKDRKQLQIKQQELQHSRNQNSKEIGKLKASKEDAADLIKRTELLGGELKSIGDHLQQIQLELNDLTAGMPNIPHESVPSGESEDDNVEQRRWGERRHFSFEIFDHVQLGEDLGMLDFEQATKLTGSRFVVMTAGLARLHRALIQFMLDLHTQEHGYEETYVPYLVNANSLFGTGQLPKFEQDQFATDTDPRYYLIPTAEVPVTNLYRDEILESFEKVELVQIVEPSTSWTVLEELTGHAEIVLQRLELPYRVVTLCTADLGFSSAKTYDLEVWLPGQQRYREISSCSNFETFQARRMRARWRNPETSKPEYVHTLNGSGLAIGRTLVAIMENYQNEDRTISVPDVLRPYLGGCDRIQNA